jgi:hypothetical protein
MCGPAHKPQHQIKTDKPTAHPSTVTAQQTWLWCRINNKLLAKRLKEAQVQQHFQDEASNDAAAKRTQVQVAVEHQATSKMATTGGVEHVEAHLQASLSNSGRFGNPKLMHMHAQGLPLENGATQDEEELVRALQVPFPPSVEVPLPFCTDLPTGEICQDRYPV